VVFIDSNLRKKLLLSIKVRTHLQKAGPLGTEKQMAVKRKRKTAKKKPVPTNKKLYARVKAQAKRKFAVYPSAYANGWLVKTYKAKGGKYRMGSK
jgi:hypothetical protein